MVRDIVLRRRVAAALMTVPLVIAAAPLLVLNALRRRSRSVSRILVLEPWGIGDVVLCTGALRSLRASYPTARITVLAKAHATALVVSPEMADAVVTYDFPWTAFSGKYRPSRYRIADLARLVLSLRRDRYDLVLNARSDVRNNILGALAGGTRFVSASCGIGNLLATERVPLSRDEHRVDDWAKVVRQATGDEPVQLDPRLTVSDTTRARLRSEFGLTDGARPVVGIHPGAQNSVRRWELRRFAAVADAIEQSTGARIIVFAEPDGYGRDLPARVPFAVVHRGLDDMMAALSLCDVVVCNDSGPMHIANALGVPVASIFGPMKTEWFAPRGGPSSVVQINDMPCRPCFDACQFAEPFCMTRIEEQAVIGATMALLARRSRGADSTAQLSPFANERPTASVES